MPCPVELTSKASAAFAASSTVASATLGAACANVRPHSGTQAHQAVFLALLRLGDGILNLNLTAGGDLSHGAGASLSGSRFATRHYGVERDTDLLAQASPSSRQFEA